MSYANDQDLNAGSLESTAALLLSRITREMGSDARPFFVGLDGRSGVGKSTLAESVALMVQRGDHDDANVLVIEGDQFYAGGSGVSWDSQSAEQKAARVIDWPKQRMVLEQLRDHGVAEFHPFDWEAPDWDADPAPLSVKAVRFGSNARGPPRRGL